MVGFVTVVLFLKSGDLNLREEAGKTVKYWTMGTDCLINILEGKGDILRAGLKP